LSGEPQRRSDRGPDVAPTPRRSLLPPDPRPNLEGPATTDAARIEVVGVVIDVELPDAVGLVLLEYRKGAAGDKPRRRRRQEIHSGVDRRLVRLRFQL